VKRGDPLRPARPPDPGTGPAAWAAAPAHLFVGPDDVHVWLLEIPRLAPLTPLLPEILETDEASRAERFRFAEDRDRFARCRAAARILLGRYVGRAPADLRFGLGPHGKPHLLGEGRPRLEFNLAHSGAVGLLAVAAGRAVGVDVERIDAGRSDREVARRFFAADEVDRLEGLPPAERLAGFFSCWTRKESYLKARGDGLSLPLASFAVSFGGGTAPSLVRSALGPGEIARWQFFDVPPLEGHAAALAVEGRGARPSFWRFELELVRR
jgi:4'-phosphopantetheinyl transferase